MVGVDGGRKIKVARDVAARHPDQDVMTAVATGDRLRPCFQGDKVQLK